MYKTSGLNFNIHNKNLIDPTSTPSNSDSLISQLPKEILSHVFSFLPLPALVQCSCVNRSWKQFLQPENPLWKSKYEQDVIDDFTSLVAQNVLTWKKVHFYARLSNFIARSVQTKYCNDKFRRQENPEFRFSLNPYVVIRPFVKHGNYSFSICDSTNIKIRKEEESELTILQGEQGKMIVNLLVKGDILFAIRQDGIIVLWNYKKKEKVREIETTYAKTYKNPTQIFYDGPNSCYVRNGILVIKYNGYKGFDGSFTEQALEIIPYSNPENSQLIPLFLESKRMIIEKNKLFILASTSVWIWDFSTTKKDSIEIEIDMLDRILDMTIDGNILYVNSCDKLHIIDLVTKQQRKFYLPSGVNTYCHIEVIGNLFFGFFSSMNKDTSDQLGMINLNTMELIKTCSFNANSHNPISELIETAKENFELKSLIQKDLKKTDPSSSKIFKLKQLFKNLKNFGPKS